jgi:DNA modification methylase
MGSGMLPSGAYVTQEHEYILLLRKGAKRQFTEEAEKIVRQKSAFFWEERNSWFSDTWEDLKGDRQALNREGVRARSAAFPFELAYRLLSMFSVQGDLVLDPFLGTGTTMLAAMASGRNSVGFEIDAKFKALLRSRISKIVALANDYNRNRISRHLEFVRTTKSALRYVNEFHRFPVMTSQETMVSIPMLKSVQELNENAYETEYLTEALKVGRFLF